MIELSDIDLLPPEIERGKIDERLWAFYDLLKYHFDGIYVNAFNGKRVNRYCGLRPQNCTIGARNSAHKLGKALDLHYKDLDSLRKYICKEGYPHGITRMECKAATPTWVHIDTIENANTVKWDYHKGIYVFKP